jgi:hypothetical protein
MNFDMVVQRIFNKEDFSTDTTIFLKTIGNGNLTSIGI